MNDNNKRPSKHDKNLEIKTLGSWIIHQSKNYKIKDKIMSNEKIYNQWTEFINDSVYKVYFQSNEEIWIDTLIKVKKYINDNNKRPPQHNEDIKTQQLANWISKQQLTYIKKEQIMKNEIIYNHWTEFINNNKYKKYFISNEDNWVDILNQVKLYIDTNNKRPTNNCKEFKIKICTWISCQKLNYKNKEQIMKNEEIYNKWTEFISDPKYKKYV